MWQAFGSWRRDSFKILRTLHKHSRSSISEALSQVVFRSFVFLKVIVISEIETLTSLEPSRVGYWASHDYFRLSVTENIEEFVGWTALLELFSLITVPIQKAFFATLFLTGGRVSEVLQLKRNNFEVMEKEGVVKVSKMRLLKRYVKLDSYVDGEGKKRWHTQTLYKTRKPFAIQLREPLAALLVQHLNSIEQPEALLFPSPQRHTRNFKKVHGPVDTDRLDVNKKLPYTSTWAYLCIRQTNRLASKNLKQRLSLDEPFMVSVLGKKEQVKIADELHLWIHWFRSQRSSQLVDDYQFEIIDLLAYFSWEDWQTANRYAKRGWRGLTEKMNRANPSYR